MGGANTNTDWEGPILTGEGLTLSEMDQHKWEGTTLIGRTNTKWEGPTLSGRGLH